MKRVRFGTNPSLFYKLNSPLKQLFQSSLLAVWTTTTSTFQIYLFSDMEISGHSREGFSQYKPFGRTTIVDGWLHCRFPAKNLCSFRAAVQNQRLPFHISQRSATRTRQSNIHIVITREANLYSCQCKWKNCIKMAQSWAWFPARILSPKAPGVLYQLLHQLPNRSSGILCCLELRGKLVQIHRKIEA